MSELPAGLLEYWQRQLRLQDWDVVADVVPARALGGAAGQTTTTPWRRYAAVQIADPATLDPDAGPGFRDLEATLVHELLHVALAGVGDHAPLEPAIEALSRALVALNRGERR